MSQFTGKPLILVIDDEEDIRLMARAALEQIGFRVETIDDSVEAPDRFLALKPSLVILDVNMPGLDGFEVCSKIRNTTAGRETPVLIITGMDDIASINKAYQHGATDFITKPINWSVLQYRIRYILRADDNFRRLQQKERELENAQRISNMGNWEWDMVDDQISCSDQLYRILGIKGHPIMNLDNLTNLIHESERNRFRLAIDSASRKRNHFEITHRIVRPNKEERIVHQQGELRYDESNTPVWMSVIVHDISERKWAEEKIAHLAYHDVLTELPNRTFFREQLKRALEEPEIKDISIVLMDLDRFNRINETFGHDAGDTLLKLLGNRLENFVARHADSVFHTLFPKLLSRFGGDEFALFLPHTGEKDSKAIIQELIETIAAPFKLNNEEVFVTVSIGVSHYPTHGQEVDLLIKNADTALFYAKSEGRNNYQTYRSQLNQASYQRLSMETQLRRALDRDEFELFYQPQIDLISGEIIGAEGLLRWRHHEQGIIPPLDFIPIAEETGLIIPIGEWVLQKASSVGEQWQHASFGPLRISVNISGRQFKDPKSLIKCVKECLNTSSLNPKLLELELTESTLMQDIDSSRQTLQALKTMGVHLSIDDFGTGYSSLSYLKRFPLNCLKIDRSFVKDIPKNRDDAAIATTIIAMAHILGMRAIAEGVELRSQLEFFRKQGCDEVQGHLLSEPITADELEILIKKRKYGGKVDTSYCAIDISD